MKYAKYLLLPLLLALLASCKDDSGTDAPASHEAVGIYRNGKSLYQFDKVMHQLSVNPTTRTFRIQDNTGAKYVEFVLDKRPDANAAVQLKMTGNIGLSDLTVDDMVLLRSTKDRIWLWSPATQTEVVLPWIGF